MFGTLWKCTWTNKSASYVDRNLAVQCYLVYYMGLRYFRVGPYSIIISISGLFSLTPISRAAAVQLQQPMLRGWEDDDCRPKQLFAGVCTESSGNKECDLAAVATDHAGTESFRTITLTGLRYTARCYTVYGIYSNLPQCMRLQ